jgi:hypothetical protein
MQLQDMYEMQDSIFQSNLELAPHWGQVRLLFSANIMHT